jgi:signal transduction histidine kinase/CheY-like chemotaxis protein
LTAVAILPLALLSGAGLYFLARQQGIQAEQVGIELARSVANAVSTELDRSITVLNTLATTPTLDTLDLATFRLRAVRVLPTQPHWGAVVLSDTTGARLLDTRVPSGAPLTPPVEPESLRRVVEQRQPVIGNLTNHPEEGWLFPVRVPVIRDGQVRFVLTALVKPDTIHDVVTRQQLPDDWVISIVDARGARVARSRAHLENLGGQLSPSAAELVARGGTQGFDVTQTLEGDRIYTPFSTIEPSGWVAVLGFPTAAMQGVALRSTAVYGAGVMLSIGLGTLGALAVARSITRPMRELRTAAEALGRGAPPLAPQTSIAEIREVGHAVSAAAARLSAVGAEREALLRNEQEARAAAEHANQAKEEFMAVLSHGLRTPLNAVYGWARLLQNAELRDEALIARAKDAIVRNADAQVRLIDELLDLARITTGKIQLNTRRVEMADVLHAAVDAVRPAAEAKHIVVTTQIDHDVRPVSGDPARLQQIVWNLLVNAVKFTGDFGKIDLRLHRLDGDLRIIVSDNGRGIAPHLLPRLFEWFRQADSSSTRTHGGLGLGLALVKHLTELHGGTVQAHSDGAGCGSTFTVVLPAADEASAPEPRSAAGPAAAQTLQKAVRLDGIRVLVVDNEEDALALSETILSAAGATVRSCTSARQALEVLTEWRPDVLISDIEMPGEDGYSLVRNVRALATERGGATPAIALSAYGRAQDRVRALSAGFNMHVPKPVDPGELTAIVAGIVAHKQDAPSSNA